jgi:formate-dependent nitrite reductase cytochrome c552 subunit
MALSANIPRPEVCKKIIFPPKHIVIPGGLSLDPGLATDPNAIACINQLDKDLSFIRSNRQSLLSVMKGESSVVNAGGNALVNAGEMCLDVHLPDMRNNGGKVQVWQCNGQPQQQWSLNGNALVNAGGMCLDVHQPDMRNNGGKVQVWQCNGQPQQQWSLNGNALVNAGGMCLDVHQPDMRNNGGKVQVWQCNEQPQQQWRF